MDTSSRIPRQDLRATNHNLGIRSLPNTMPPLHPDSASHGTHLATAKPQSVPALACFMTAELSSGTPRTTCSTELDSRMLFRSPMSQSRTPQAGRRFRQRELALAPLARKAESTSTTKPRTVSSGVLMFNETFRTG